MIRVLVTGASGYIGGTLVKRLESTDFEVTKVNRNSARADTLSLDVATDKFSEKIGKLERFDYIYHFGAPGSIIEFNKDPVYCVRNTLRGFRNILKLAELDDAKLVYPSSGSVYGTAPSPLNELSEPEPTNLYALCRLQCEEMAMDSKAECVGLRIFTGYGPGEETKGEGGSAIYHFLREMVQGKPPTILGDGTQTRDFIYIEDIVDGLLSAINSFIPPIVNLGSGKNLSFNKVVRIINRCLKTDIEPVYIEKPKSYVENTLADISLMRKTLNITPRPLEEGITNFIDYLNRRKELSGDT
jgi:nucleoside-diphosphate-sugar epimerase